MFPAWHERAGHFPPRPASLLGHGLILGHYPRHHGGHANVFQLSQPGLLLLADGVALRLDLHNLHLSARVIRVLVIAMNSSQGHTERRYQYSLKDSQPCPALVQGSLLRAYLPTLTVALPSEPEVGPRFPIAPVPAAATARPACSTVGALRPPQHHVRKALVPSTKSMCDRRFTLVRHVISEAQSCESTRKYSVSDTRDGGQRNTL